MRDVTEIENEWARDVRDTLDRYIAIPNVSPAFDEQWADHGYMNDAVELYEKWAREHAPSTAHIAVQKIEGKTPLLIIDIPAYQYESKDTVLLYGHLDKQPPMEGWINGREAFVPTYEEDRLYGRGSADDGYAMFAAVLAVRALHDSHVTHARCVILIEASEESGSPDLPEHLEYLTNTLHEPLEDVSLVVCLDSGCLDNDHLWVTQSLRGLLQINIEVRVLDQGTHSGGAGGIVPSSTHTLRALLDRICDSPSGKIRLEQLHAEIPDYVTQSAHEVARVVTESYDHGLPFACGVEPLSGSVAQQLIANTYEPALEIIGVEGLPNIADAGNVLRPFVKAALSFRLPPLVDPHVAAAAIVEQLNSDIPYGAQVSVVVDSLARGWAAPEIAPWLNQACDQASRHYFSREYHVMGEGGTIPFMAMLGEKYPSAQFLVTGVLGPGSNAHGPNEFLHLPTAHKVTGCVSHVVQAHASREK